MASASLERIPTVPSDGISLGWHKISGSEEVANITLQQLGTSFYAIASSTALAVDINILDHISRAFRYLVIAL